MPRRGDRQQLAEPCVDAERERLPVGEAARLLADAGARRATSETRSSAAGDAVDKAARAGGQGAPLICDRVVLEPCDLATAPGSSHGLVTIW